MGKKAKSTAGKKKAEARKLDRTTLPPPPPKPEDEVGSAKPLDKPALPGTGFKVIGSEGYDDGGVADLSREVLVGKTWGRRVPPLRMKTYQKHWGSFQGQSF
eukprot:g2483.t1 g2483   contig12:219501-219903(-)